MADIFISYSQKDREIVAPLAAFLEGHGYDVWWDTELTGGVEFRREIGRQLAAARAVVVVWSANSIASNFVLDEAGVAEKAGKLVPVREAGFSPDAIPMGFRQYHAELVSDHAALLRALWAKGVAPSQTRRETSGAAAGAAAQPRWMWWSTHDSIDKEVPSVWAIVETVLAIAAYWAIAVYFDTYVHLLAGVAVAPLVLLRSDASVHHGLKMVEWVSVRRKSELHWSQVDSLSLGTWIVGALSSSQHQATRCLTLLYNVSSQTHTATEHL